MHELDLFPEAKAVQATFEPVMIDGHGQKQGEKDDERPIAGLIPSHFVEGYRADRSDDEQDETPAGEWLELAAVARAITRSSFATRRVSAWAFVIGVTGWFWSIAPTLLDGEECVNSSPL